MTIVQVILSSLNTADSNVTDMNIPHIIECFSLVFCNVHRRSFFVFSALDHSPLFKNDPDSTDNSDSFSSFPMINFCGLISLWFSQRVCPVRSWGHLVTHRFNVRLSSMATPLILCLPLRSRSSWQPFPEQHTEKVWKHGELKNCWSMRQRHPSVANNMTAKQHQHLLKRGVETANRVATHQITSTLQRKLRPTGMPPKPSHHQGLRLLIIGTTSAHEAQHAAGTSVTWKVTQQRLTLPIRCAQHTRPDPNRQRCDARLPPCSKSWSCPDEDVCLFEDHNGLPRSILRYYLIHNGLSCSIVLGLLMKDTWLGLVCFFWRGHNGLPRSIIHRSVCFPLLRRPSFVSHPTLSSVLRKSFPKILHDNSQTRSLGSLPTTGCPVRSSLSAFALQGFWFS